MPLRRARYVLLLLAPACLAIASACGGSGSPDANPGAGTPEAGSEAASDGARPTDDGGPPDAASAPDGGGGCVVDTALVTGSSDFYERPQLTLRADGSGALVHAANGASTGALVSGSYWTKLGAGALPSGAPARVSMQLHHDVAQGPGGVVLATATNTSEGVKLQWLDQNGAASRTESVAASINNRLPAVTVAGSVTYVAWVLDSFTSGAASDTLWVAGYDATQQIFGPTKVTTPQTQNVQAHLAAVSGTAYLVWSGGAAGSSTVSWAKVDAAGNVAPPVSATAAGQAEGVAVRGDTLAFAWTKLKQLSPTIQTGVEIRLANLTTGAALGTLSIGSSSTSKERQPALVSHSKGFALAIASDDAAAGAVQYVELSPALGIVRRVKVASSVRSSLTVSSSVDIAVNAAATYVAYANESGATFTARITCP